MAGSLNKVILIGNLGKDPESRQAQDGSKIVNLSVATSEQWKDKASDERRERVEWHRVVIFNPRLADIVERFFKKGHKVYVEGQIQTRKWMDNQNQEQRVQEVIIRFKGDIVLLDGRGEQSSSDYRSNTSSMDTMSAGGAGGFDSSTIIDDEIPF
jgi:single-strand DNA-binding protein